MLQFDNTPPGGKEDSFYAAYQMLVEGSCFCHGHATSCVHSDQSQDSISVGVGRGGEGGGVLYQNVHVFRV